MSDDSYDAAWLDARERGDSIDHVDVAARTRYANLQRHLAALPDLDPPAGWQDRVIARLDYDSPTTRRRSAVWWLAGGAAAATVAIAIAMRSGAGDPFELAVEREGTAYRGDRDLLVHDLLHIHAASRLAALRVYSAQGTMLAGCPGGPNCTDGDLVIKLQVPDTLAIVGFADCTPPRAHGELRADVIAATSDGCTVIRHEPLHVR